MGHAIRHSMVYMAYRYRKDIVGKRFLCVHARCQDASCPASPKQNCANKRVNGSNHLSASCPSKASAVQCRREPASWHWRAGVVRAATHRNTSHPELQVNMISRHCFMKNSCIPARRPLLGHFVSVLTPKVKKLPTVKTSFHFGLIIIQAPI